MGWTRNGYEEFGEESSEKRTLCSYSLPKRYVLAIIALPGYDKFKLRSPGSLRCCFFAMTTNKMEEPADFDWDLTIRGHTLGSSYWGYLISQIPDGILAKRYGGKPVFGRGIFCSSVLSIFISYAKVSTWSVRGKYYW